MEQTYEWIRLAQAGDAAAKDNLLQENSGLIWSVVGRFRGRGEPEDLYQIGAIGLLKCIEKFDFSYDVKFSTYAVPMILGEIKRFLRDDGTVKVSRSLKELAWRALTGSGDAGGKQRIIPTGACRTIRGRKRGAGFGIGIYKGCREPVCFCGRKRRHLTAD